MRITGGKHRPCAVIGLADLMASGQVRPWERPDTADELQAWA